jgi:hypothetical protein
MLSTGRFSLFTTTASHQPALLTRRDVDADGIDIEVTLIP